MMTGHQRIQLRRAGFRVEDEVDGIFTAILDHPTMADAFDFPFPDGRRDDIDSITLPCVAFSVARRKRVEQTPRGEVVVRMEWWVVTRSTEPDDRGIHHVPNLDARGEEALAFLKHFVAVLTVQESSC